MKWLIVISFFCFSLEAQVIKSALPSLKDPGKNEQNLEVLKILRNIEKGIQTNRIDKFENQIGPIVSIVIGSDERGGFSKNQTYLILLNYFSTHRPVAFEFSKISAFGSTPYATGRYIYSLKGNQESVQVYVSLSWQEKRWIINQFNIY